ncbi:hypothetical protein A0H76_1179 [Hepatospora eriocheir]|uniref:Secreted protein n=1 Tax=Hepatospora eriocheir TaxID=1081669 RepID=A0A1X0Q6W9_9MICR|nr:hypothetical protein HERIO_2442 [Hepatospora eriocheir]ORE00390.1 hypothetical protein A0H76_1179 [Hepatospora eriocheir]
MVGKLKVLLMIVSLYLTKISCGGGMTPEERQSYKAGVFFIDATSDTHAIPSSKCLFVDRETNAHYEISITKVNLDNTHPSTFTPTGKEKESSFKTETVNN